MRSVILSSIFAVGVYSVRVAEKSVERESHASDFVPGQMPLPPSAATPGVSAVMSWNASVRVGDAPQVNIHGGRRAVMMMAGEDPLVLPGEYNPNLPNDWRSLPAIWDDQDQTYKKRDKNGKWRDAKGRFTGPPPELAEDDQTRGPTDPSWYQEWLDPAAYAKEWLANNWKEEKEAEVRGPKWTGTRWEPNPSEWWEMQKAAKEKETQKDGNLGATSGLPPTVESEDAELSGPIDSSPLADEYPWSGRLNEVPIWTGSRWEPDPNEWWEMQKAAKEKEMQKDGNSGATSGLPPTVESEDAQRSGPSDSTEHVNDYNLNLVEAFESLRRDIPQGLQLERDPQRVTPTNWDIYSDSFETDFNVADPTALRFLEAIIPSWTSSIKGLRSNQRVLKEIRTLVETLRFAQVLDSADVTDSTHMGRDASTGEEFVESRWITKFKMKTLRLPEWVPKERLLPPVGSGWAKFQPKVDVNIEGVSRFYLNAEGKVYRHSIDEFKLVLEDENVGLEQLNEFLGKLIRYWPDYGK